jgi:hypothetical protein
MAFSQGVEGISYEDTILSSPTNSFFQNPDAKSERLKGWEKKIFLTRIMTRVEVYNHKKW